MATLCSVASARVIPTLVAATPVSTAHAHGTSTSIDRPWVAGSTSQAHR